MIKICIKNPVVATQAGEWCKERFSKDKWDLRGQNLFTDNTKYYFEFKDEQDASMFGLRWLSED